MNYFQKDKPKILIFAISLIIFLVGFKVAYAETQKDITATVRISVCGDSVVEYPEDCEGADLNGEDCVSQGYLEGTLTCDIACSFDTTGCTLTPTPTATPTQSSSSTSTTSTTTETTTTAKKEDNLVKEIIRKIDLKLKLIQKNFDADSSGKIEVYELYNTVKTWVEDWKINIEVETAFAKGEISEKEVTKPEKCDLNNDGVCNVIDLSILLYYIER